MKIIEEKKKDRFKFLNKVYDEKVNTWSTSDTRSVCEKLGFNENEGNLIVQYLVDEYLVKSLDDASSRIQITHKGVVEIEQALSEPEKPTEHFLPIVNYINNTGGNMSGVQILQGSTQSSQTQTITQEQTDSIKEFVKLFNEKLEEIPFASEEDKQEAISEVKTISAQLESPKPKLEYLKQATSTLTHIINKIPSEIVKHAFIGELLHLLSTVDFHQYVDKVDKLLK